MGGNGIVAARTIRNDGILTTRYITTDHLGSVSVITDEAGGIDEQMSYDAFGMRRNPANWQDYSALPALTDVTDKGYTGQQQMDAVGLVHMNGRVYDPVVGRFMSADPTVPDPLDGQSFNRYAYVENNPLSAIDPSGFGCPQGGYCITIPGKPGTWNLIGVSSSQYQLPGPPPALGALSPLNDNLSQSQAPYIDTPAPVISPTVIPPDTTPSVSPKQVSSSQSSTTTQSNNNNGGSLFNVPPPPLEPDCANQGGCQEPWDLQLDDNMEGFQTWDGSIFNDGPGITALRPKILIEIPSPGAPTGGGPTVGPHNAIGSQGISLNTKLDLFAGSIGYTEYSHRVGGMWKGLNGKWYSLDWGGNGATGARGLASGIADASHVASELSFALSVGVNGYHTYTALKARKWNDVGQPVVDTVFAGVMAFGGLPGFAIGGIYFIVQDTIGWDNVFKADDQFYAQFPNWSPYGYGGYNGP